MTVSGNDPDTYHIINISPYDSRVISRSHSLSFHVTLLKGISASKFSVYFLSLYSVHTQRAYLILLALQLRVTGVPHEFPRNVMRMCSINWSLKILLIDSMEQNLSSAGLCGRERSFTQANSHLRIQKHVFPQPAYESL